MAHVQLGGGLVLSLRTASDHLKQPGPRWRAENDLGYSQRGDGLYGCRPMAFWSLALAAAMGDTVSTRNGLSKRRTGAEADPAGCYRVCGELGDGNRNSGQMCMNIDQSHGRIVHQ
jgi:hypothetical protein